MSSGAPAERAIRLSLIIPTFQREELLVQTLQCALNQDRDDYEILLIDQTPEHEQATGEFLARHAARIRLIKLSRPSVTAARNAGLRNARGEVVVFIDDDTTFGPDFLSHHLAAYEAGVGAVQGRVTEQGMREHKRPIWLNRWIRFRGGDNCPDDGLTNNLTGCNFSLDREAAERVGLFDERYAGVAVREESDYALRVVAAGYAIRYSAGAAVLHHRADTGGHGEGGDALFFNKLYYFNEFLFSKKHFSPMAVWLYRIRLKRRGRRALRHLMERAEREADQALKER